MLQDIDLRSLAEIRGNGRDVISAYFAGAEGLDSLAARERQLEELLKDDELEADNFQQSMQAIRELLKEHPLDDAAGVCFFASEVLGVAKGFPIMMPVPRRLMVGPAPYIRPLAELQDEYETFSLVVCDNDRTRVFSVTNEVAEANAAIRGGIKNHVRKGGWSQQRYERRRDEQLHRYADDIVKAIAAQVAEQAIERIVLLGSEETMLAIEDCMPELLKERVVGREPFDLHREQEDWIEAAYESYFQEERESERDLWQRIKGEALRGGRAVTGLSETLEAAKIGRVEAAVVTRDARPKATQCRDCDDVQAGQPPRCESCGSDNVFPVDAIDALARHLELTSATIDFVDPIKGLTRCGDVAAMLRY